MPSEHVQCGTEHPACSPERPSIPLQITPENSQLYIRPHLRYNDAEGQTPIQNRYKNGVFDLRSRTGTKWSDRCISMDITATIIQFLESTAWEMESPKVGSAFHIMAMVIVTVVACAAAVFVARIGNNGQITKDNSGDAVRIRILFVLGVLLLISEIYKQLFYYFIINNGAYDWWQFPFQLCSVPMYLCILLPFCGEKLQKVILTFMCGYTFVGAVAALIWPESILRPYVTLTLHGQIWHGILLFISIMIGLSGMADLTIKGFLRSTVLFLFLCAVAIVINMIAEPISIANPVYDENGILSYPSMFYLSPYHPSYQPIIYDIDKAAGRPAAMAIYTLLIITAAGIVDFLFYVLTKHEESLLHK